MQFLRILSIHWERLQLISKTRKRLRQFSLLANLAITWVDAENLAGTAFTVRMGTLPYRFSNRIGMSRVADDACALSCNWVRHASTSRSYRKPRLQRLCSFGINPKKRGTRSHHEAECHLKKMALTISKAISEKLSRTAPQTLHYNDCIGWTFLASSTMNEACDHKLDK